MIARRESVGETLRRLMPRSSILVVEFPLEGPRNLV